MSSSSSSSSSSSQSEASSSSSQPSASSSSTSSFSSSSPYYSSHDESSVSSESGGPTTVTLTPSQTSVNRGVVTLPEWENFSTYTTLADQLSDAKDDLETYSKRITTADGQPSDLDVQMFSNALKRATELMNQISGLGYTFTPGSNLGTLPTINLTLSSDPNELQGEVRINQESTWAELMHAQSDVVGSLSNESGTTEFQATFSLNGNYGSVYFIGEADGENSNVVVVSVYGQTREQAEAEMDQYLNQVRAEFDRVQMINRQILTALVSVNGIIASLLLGAAMLTPAGWAILVLAALVVAAIYEFRAHLERQAFQEWEAAYRAKLQPFLETLPSGR